MLELINYVSVIIYRPLGRSVILQQCKNTFGPSSSGTIGFGPILGSILPAACSFETSYTFHYHLVFVALYKVTNV